MKIGIWVNHYGWICGGNAEKGFRFTKMRAGAKPFADFSDELFDARVYIENKMQCNYDLHRIA